MSDAQDLLIEIGTEELPPKALRCLSLAFADEITKGLDNAALQPETMHVYATPRRLALLLKALPDAQQDHEITRRGPALAAAFDDEGCPTQAAIGFAKSCGVEVEALDQLETKKGSWLSFRAVKKGLSTTALIPDLVSKALAALPVPKRMRWGDHNDEFVRPIHWIVLLYGDTVIDATILGIQANRYTRGHRFHHPEAIYLTSPEAYLPILKTQGYVIADYHIRQETIRTQAIEQANILGGQALINEDLLNEVTALVEWPVAISGRFDNAFLDVPSEALISSMQDHQKYFPVIDTEGHLLPYFITIANLSSTDPAQIKAGNERVIRPRLADAAFFWNQDRKQPLSERAERLRSMVFQKQLGTLFDKQERMADLAGRIADLLDTPSEHTVRAATLCKCDLLTSMVKEFPELQGIMGRYYANHDGEADSVANAIQEHYLPRFAGDALPSTATAQALALADRLDSLTGIFATGQQPTGVKDPYALRRAALGIIRICIEKQLNLDLEILLKAAANTLKDKIDAQATVGNVFDYIMDRLQGYYQDKGVDVDIIDAVLATRPTRLLDLDQRIKACQAFRRLPEAESLAAANKRISNILKKTNKTISNQLDVSRLLETAERQLASALDNLNTEVVPLMESGDYTPALTRLASLRDPVDAFFDQVRVMVDDDIVRNNRLALLRDLRNLFLRVADLSRLQS